MYRVSRAFKILDVSFYVFFFVMMVGSLINILMSLDSREMKCISYIVGCEIYCVILACYSLIRKDIKKKIQLEEIREIIKIFKNSEIILVPRKNKVLKLLQKTGKIEIMGHIQDNKICVETKFENGELYPEGEYNLDYNSCTKFKKIYKFQKAA